MITITTNQTTNIKNTFNSGMTRAAIAFSKILGINVIHEPVHVFITDGHTKLYPVFKTHEPLTVISTPTIGDVTGKSFLVMDQSDIQYIMKSTKIVLPKDPSAAIQQEILKEIDNILSAAFITCLSNELKMDLYGDVPHLETMSSLAANELIETTEGKNKVSIVCQSSFSTPASDKLSPQFIWKLSNSIIR